MIGVAANDATERDEAVEAAAAPAGFGSEKNCRRNLERTRNGDTFEICPGEFDGGRCTVQQRIGNMGVKPRLYDQDPGRHDLASFRPRMGCVPRMLSP